MAYELFFGEERGSFFFSQVYEEPLIETMCVFRVSQATYLGNKMFHKNRNRTVSFCSASLCTGQGQEPKTLRFLPSSLQVPKGVICVLGCWVPICHCAGSCPKSLCNMPSFRTLSSATTETARCGLGTCRGLLALPPPRS